MASPLLAWDLLMTAIISLVRVGISVGWESSNSESTAGVSSTAAWGEEELEIEIEIKCQILTKPG